MTEEEKRDRALQEVKMYLANDWDVKEETPDYFLLKRNKASVWGHLLIILFLWWSFGIANIIYWRASLESKKVMK